MTYVDELATHNPIGFDKMRAMLGRAAEARASEQQQLYDMLEDLRGRLSPLEGFAAEGRGQFGSLNANVASVQQRISDLPDRNEVSVIAERLDEALARIDAQDRLLAQLMGTINALSERVGKPLDALEARLDGVAGRFEGVAGRLDGLDDRQVHLHSRLDEVDTAVNGLRGSVESLPAQLDIPAVHRRFDEVSGTLQARFDQLSGRLDGVDGKLDAAHGKLDAAQGKLDAAQGNIDAVHGKLDGLHDTVCAGIGTLAGAVEQGVDKLDTAISARADRDELVRTLRSVQSESEHRITQGLDDALAAFTEVMLGQSYTKGSGRSGGRLSGKKSWDAENYDD